MKTFLVLLLAVLFSACCPVKSVRKTDVTTFRDSTFVPPVQSDVQDIVLTDTLRIDFDFVVLDIVQLDQDKTKTPTLGQNGQTGQSKNYRIKATSKPKPIEMKIPERTVTIETITEKKYIPGWAWIHMAVGTFFTLLWVKAGLNTIKQLASASWRKS